MKRFLVLTLICVLLFSLVGCGGGGRSARTTPTEAPAPTEAPTPTADPAADGQKVEIFDLTFYLPKQFKAYEGNGVQGTWYFFNKDKAPSLSDDPQGVECYVSVLNTKETFVLEDWVQNYSFASIYRIMLSYKTIDGVTWLIGDRNDDRFFYAQFNGRVYEMLLRRDKREDPEGDLPAMIDMVQKTLHFEKAEG